MIDRFSFNPCGGLNCSRLQIFKVVLYNFKCLFNNVDHENKVFNFDMFFIGIDKFNNYIYTNKQ